MLKLRAVCLIGLWVGGLNPPVIQEPERGTIRGTVSSKGQALPGAQVTAVSAAARASAVTNEKGEYRLTGLPDGSCTITAVMAGFRPASKSQIAVVAGRPVIVDVSLELGYAVEVLWVEPVGGLTAAVREADAVLYLRVQRTLEAKPWQLGDESKVISTLCEARVLGVVKAHPIGIASGQAIQFLQEAAGTWKEGPQTLTGCESLYSAGDEYVAFLRWEPTLTIYRRFAGPTLMIPVRNGRIAGPRSKSLGISEDLEVSRFLAYLRSLLKSGGSRN